MDPAASQGPSSRCTGPTTAQTFSSAENSSRSHPTIPSGDSRTVLRTISLVALAVPTLALLILPLLLHFLPSLANRRLLLLPLPPPLPVAVVLVLGLDIALELLVEAMTIARMFLLAKVGSALRRQFLLELLQG